MEIGARFQPDGRCRFRVFAPEASRVTVEFPSRRESRPLEREAGGYWSAAWPDVPHGERYLLRPGEGPARPDPASLSQPDGVHGPSQAWDHRAFRWNDSGWKGLALDEMIMYELHAGTFTSEGTLEAAAARLDHLADLGVNAVEIMPVNQFPGRWGWGYDGTYPFAVQASYGGPDSLKRLVEACHARGTAVILDVVYNHLGPEGNYLRDFGPYFTDRYRTPWGQALNFDGPDSAGVRNFFIENALHWLRDYHVDALRLDAVHQVHDESARPFLAELSDRVREFSRRDGRERYLIAESDLNDDRVLRETEAGGLGFHAQWLDDFQHALEALAHDKGSLCRQDFGHASQLAKAYREGYVYSGEYSAMRRMPFGRSSAGRPAREFVAFIQNHDQVGNRPAGERFAGLCGFEFLKLAAGASLLSPYIPLLFMGEEYGETQPFLFFADYGDPALVEAVREGRKREFRHRPQDPEPPDPVAEATFLASRLDWRRKEAGRNRLLFELYKSLIRLRKSHPALARPDRGNLDVTGLGQVILVRRRDPGRGGAPDTGFAIFLNFGKSPADLAGPLPGGNWERVFDSSDREWDGPGSSAPERLGPGGGFRLNPGSLTVYRAAQSP